MRAAGRAVSVTATWSEAPPYVQRQQSATELARAWLDRRARYLKADEECLLEGLDFSPEPEMTDPTQLPLAVREEVFRLYPPLAVLRDLT